MPKIYTDEQREDAIRLRVAGRTYQSIADELGIRNMTTIYEWCQGAGLPCRQIKKGKYRSGQRYGEFVLLEPAPNHIASSGRIYSRWRCQCDCGEVFTVTTKQIKRGRKSCGCATVRGRFQRKSTKEVIVSTKLQQYQSSASRRGIEWNLSEAMFERLCFEACHYCGSAPALTVIRNTHELNVNGVDRVDNTQGYEEGNVVPCCFICNRAKGSLSYEDFKDWISRISK